MTMSIQCACSPGLADTLDEAPSPGPAAPLDEVPSPGPAVPLDEASMASSCASEEQTVCFVLVDGLLSV